MPGRREKGGIYAVKQARKVGKIKPIVPLSRRPGAMLFFTPEQAALFDTQPLKRNGRSKP